MSNVAILLPVFVQVALTFFLLFRMANARVGSIKRREVKMSDIALGQRNWSDRTIQIGNAFHNQFELPMLFYVLVALIIATGKVSSTLVVHAWAFVVLRIFHALVHTGSNDVTRRFYAFAAGFFVLLAMWVVFAYDIVTAANV